MSLTNGKDEQVSNSMRRRSFLIGIGVVAVGLMFRRFQERELVRAAAPSNNLPKTVTIVEFTDAGQRKAKETVATIVKTDDEWKKLLSPLSYDVTRHGGTERAYTDENPNGHAKGVFRCICCETALFDSATKFESGTGWPSFWAPIAKENIVETTDSSFGMERTAVSCRRCDAHLGHVFDDGPPPTGLRHCMNAVAMKFDKTA